jgi:dipeptidyl aminopeptidase/acylaminoacyl peptidase
MTPDDIRAIVVVEELDLSVDVGPPSSSVGRSRATAISATCCAIDLASRRAVPTPRQLTRGTIRDTKPRICPDGTTVAFIRTDPDDDDSVAAIGLLDLRRPERVRMARLGAHGGVAEIAWSPDGRRLAFTAEVDPPRFIAGRTRRSRVAGRPRARTLRRRSPGTSPARTGDGTRRVTATAGRTSSSRYARRSGRAR